jgi:ATP-dependent RNA helicase RhlE
MLDIGFIQDIRRIVAAVPAKRQTLMFSATLPSAIMKLAGEMLVRPTKVAVAPSATTVTDVAQIGHPVDHDRKRSLLVHRLKDGAMRRTIVFTRTNGANHLTDHLERNGHRHRAAQQQEPAGADKALGDFRAEGAVLVATDIASRAIDVADVSTS